MIIYNEDKTKILTDEEVDLTKGSVNNVIETIHHDEIPYVEEVGHYETIATYPNGGKDVKWVIDVEGKQYHEAYDEQIEVGYYHVWTDEELEKHQNELKISELKQYLLDTDYIVVKISEKQIMGIDVTEDLKTYSDIIKKREEARDQINTLEEL